MKKVLNGIPLKLRATIAGLIVAATLSWIYQDNIHEYGFWIIMSFYITALLVILPFAISQRDNPNTTIYYLINPNRLSLIPKIVLALGILLCVAVYWFAQN